MDWKKASIIVLFVFILSVTLSAEYGDTADMSRGPSVEAIYENIRYAAPIYEWEESVISFEHQGMTVVCSLTIPKTYCKCPIVITLNGFAGVRDSSEIPGTNEGIFKRTARILAEQGFASLRVDFRGQGDSDGTYDMTTFETQISDVHAALNYIRRNLRHRVDKNSIGILGFSQGGIAGGVAAARDQRVDSLVLWSTPSSAPHCYEGLFNKSGIRQGLAAPAGEPITLPVGLDGEYYFDITLRREFFEGLFSISPITEIGKYKGPLMTIGGLQDPIVWPQPASNKLFMDAHEGYEKMVVIDGDHAFNYWDGPVPERLDDAIYWSTAWFIKTLK